MTVKHLDDTDIPWVERLKRANELMEKSAERVRVALGWDGLDGTDLHEHARNVIAERDSLRSELTRLQRLTDEVLARAEVVTLLLKRMHLALDDARKKGATP